MAAMAMAHRQRWHSIALTAVTLALFGLAVHVLRSELEGHSLRQLLLGVTELPARALITAIAATIAGYAALALYDVPAVRLLGKPLSRFRTMLGSFVNFAFVNNTGHTLVVGAIVRFRMHSRSGLGAGDIAELVGFGVLTYWAGMLPLAAFGLLVDSDDVSRVAEIPLLSVRLLGAACAIGLFGLIAFFRYGPSTIRLGRWNLKLPPVRVALLQIAISATDIACAAFALHALLPSEARAHVSAPAFVGLFAVVQFIGLASQVPGGLGVVEAIFVKVFAPEVDAPAIVASLLAFRIIYGWAPFAVGAATLAVESLRPVPRRTASGPESSLPDPLGEPGADHDR